HHATALRPCRGASACRVRARRQLGRGHDRPAQEILGDLAVYQNLAKNTATFLHRLTSRGGSVTSALLHDTHVTGLQASFLSYLRTCRAQ
ncbi:hypothetical protein AB0G77_34460, partial [Streptomyces hygroscopicus]